MPEPSSSIKCRVVVLISGNGSNLQALLDAASTEQTPYQICAVVSNRPNAGGLARAAKHNIDQVVLDHTLYPSREAFDQTLAETVQAYQPDLIVLAGFMRILTDAFVNLFSGRLINIHPSLLPKYPGLHTHQRALDAGDSHAGCTVHFVSNELDGGPPIVQAQTAIDDCNNADEVASKVQVLEHHIYPLAVQWFATGRIKQHDGHCSLDNKALPSSGYLYNKNSQV